MYYTKIKMGLYSFLKCLAIVLLVGIATEYAVRMVAASSPMNCPGVPSPTIEQAQQELEQHGDIAWLAAKVGADPILFAQNKLKYDYCYLQEHNLTTQCQIAQAQWSMFVGFAGINGIQIPIVTPTVLPTVLPTPLPTPTVTPTLPATQDDSMGPGVQEEPLY